MYCNSYDQLTNRFDTVLQHDCLKAVTSPASQWHKLCLCQIVLSLCHGCEGKVQSENGHLLLSARLCEIWMLATRSDSESRTSISCKVRSSDSGGLWGPPHCMRYSSLPCPLLSQRNNSVHGAGLAQVFLFLLAPGLTRRQHGTWEGEHRMSTCHTVLSLGGQDSAVRWVDPAHSPNRRLTAEHHLRLLAKTVLGADGAYTWFPSMPPATVFVALGEFPDL